MDLFISHLGIGNASIDANTTAFDTLGKKEREFYMTRATEILAAELWNQDHGARKEAGDRAEMLDKRKRDELAAIADRTGYMKKLNLNTLEGRVRFFVGIGGHVTLLNEFAQSIGDTFTGVEKTLEVANQRGYSGHMLVTLEKAYSVCVVGDTAAVGLPPTTTATLSGVKHSFYASRSMTKALGFNSPALSFKWHFEVRPGDVFSSPVIDPNTGTLPAIGSTIDRLLRECANKERLLFDFLAR